MVIVAEPAADTPAPVYVPDARPRLPDGRRPSLMLEQRMGMELAQLIASPVYYGIGVPRGDGSPVLLIPGFMGSDTYLAILHSWLGRIGYRPYLSGLAINAGRPMDLVARLLRRVDTIYEQTGKRMTIIGHSLGGVFGNVLARLRPDAVKHVITLGSPIFGDPRSAAHPLVAAMGNVLLRDSSAKDLEHEREMEESLLAGRVPDGVALSCIYSKEDAVVHWRACFDDDPRTVSFEVRGTHCGLAWNAQAYNNIARQLLMVA